VADRMAVVSALDDGAFVGTEAMRRKISCFFCVAVDDGGVSGVSDSSDADIDADDDDDDDADMDEDLDVDAAAAAA